MKIAVSSQNFRTITPHAGKARRFIIFEGAAGQEPVEVDRLDLAKELTIHEFNGDGAHPLDAVQVVLTSSFGEGFGRRMAARGIAAVATPLTDPVEAVKAYLTSPESALTTAEATCGCDHEHEHGHGHMHAHRHGHAQGANDPGIATEAPTTTPE